MAAIVTKAYPLSSVNGVPIQGIPGVPHVVTEAPTKADAEALEATGAFTLNPSHPDRLRDADAPTEPASVAVTEE